MGPFKKERTMATATRTRDHTVQASFEIIEAIFGGYQPRDFAVRLWDGTEWPSAPDQPRAFTLVLRHPGALRAMFLPPNEIHLAEAYIYDDFDIEGDIEAIYPLAAYLQRKDWGRGEMVLLTGRLLSLPRHDHTRAAARLHGGVHSRLRDRQAISYHYDRSNDFYALFLDQRMVYSCAYFQTPEDDLDTAQAQKLDYICRKLRLQPSERLLDIGCGWGGLLIYAAQHYGVRAHGITLSEKQAQLARERIHAAGLNDRCSVEIRDYREVEAPGAYDKLVSVGMFEHVGAAMLPAYFRQAYRLLKPGGVFLNHGIALSADNPPIKSDSFIARYVFPDGELVPLNTTLHAAEGSHFEVRDVESLREHYALTLHHWVRNLEANADAARRMTDDITYRIWRLYMSGSIYGFMTRQVNLYQTLLVKSGYGLSGLPLSRADWYTGRG
jgi:cyclopropane-fatty-acyl-phospholipid synthase